MIREWCVYCGQRLVKDECVYLDGKGVRYWPKYDLRCDAPHEELAPVAKIAELFWTAIAHERAKLTSTNGWCDACGERACGCSTDPSEKGRV